ncbi:hypothetical protein DMA15_02125 [Streptomyces sp. WAC 01529]|uniref:hypothetical protein n=1 Tax=Streptomyces sp. WAC 01529 TaxID=2203205 RepID=UPI000F6DAFF9|nr:hypothetical protein [Streptomyces sp. WAC 01529]AZM51524.1 hypothetical protein DMA15_02125 [Streptomyces sp. WAC 01529]
MRRTNGLARVLLPSVLVAGMLGAVTPAATAAEPAACAWKPAVLPMPTGARAGVVDAADGSGGYAGTISYGANSAKGGRAVLWKNGRFTDYGNLADPAYRKWVTVVGVNRSGTVVGSVEREGDGFPSAVRSSNGRIKRLPELPGAFASTAEGVNDRGDIVGAMTDTEDVAKWYPVIWPADKPGTVQRLTGLPDASVVATGIDEDGTVLVDVEHEVSEELYLWKGGTARKLAAPDNAQAYIPRGIANGRVIAEVTSAGNVTRSVLWDRDGQPRVVERGADIRDINRDGQLVGRTDDPSWQEFGVWQGTSLAATLHRTDESGLELTVSSDDGTIAGRSWRIPGGHDEPTVWTCRGVLSTGQDTDGGIAQE